MKNLGYSVDLGDEIDWEYLIEYKLGWEISADQNFLGQFYGVLCDNIMKVGFTTPICVYRTEIWNEAIQMDEEVFAQGNGHHRLCLAILLGLDWIPVLFSFDGDYMHSDVTGS